MFVSELMTGTAVGMAVGQWFVLQNFMRGSGWWVLVSAAGGLLGGYAAPELNWLAQFPMVFGIQGLLMLWYKAQVQKAAASQP